MKFVYTPEGLEPREWEFEPTKLMSPECMAIEKLTGLTFVEWAQQVERGSMQAVHAYLWVLLKRENPTLRSGEVQFTLEEIDWVPGDDEARTVLEHYAGVGADEMTDADREVVRDVREKFPHIAAALAEPEPDDEPEDDGEPKAESLPKG